MIGQDDVYRKRMAVPPFIVSELRPIIYYKISCTHHDSVTVIFIMLYRNV